MSYYDKAATCVANVLGTEYKIFLDVSKDDDPILETCDGYCDKTVHRIVIAAPEKDANLADFVDYQKQLMRHELVHAFLFESGLDGNSAWHVEGEEHPEQTVEWIARQFPKMIKTFREVGAL